MEKNQEEDVPGSSAGVSSSKMVAWQRRLKLKSGTQGATATNNFKPFTVPDDLSLKLTDMEDPIPNVISPDIPQENEPNEELTFQNVRDENCRLKKLINDKEAEIKLLKKKSDDSLSLGGSIANDVAAIKIVELSRKIRDLTAELESERTKTKQLQKMIYDLQNKTAFEKNSSQLGLTLPLPSKLNSSFTKAETESSTSELQEKLHYSNTKLSEYRNTCQMLKKDLKMAHKALLQEVGDGLTVQAALSGSGWRGRAQQIISLQNKFLGNDECNQGQMVTHTVDSKIQNFISNNCCFSVGKLSGLKSQLESQKCVEKYSNESDHSAGEPDGKNISLPATPPLVSQGSFVDSRHREQIKKLEKDRKDDKEKILADLKSVETEYQQTKEKLDASKARIHILNSENQKLKAKLSALVLKGDHDDELVKALTDQANKLRENQNQFIQTNKQELQSINGQHQEEVDKLRVIIGDREERIMYLQDEMQYMRKQQKMESRTSRGLQSLSPQGPSSAPLLRSICNAVEVNSHAIKSPFRSPDFGLERNGTLPELSSDGNENEIEDLHNMCQEYRVVAQAAQVEKEKLLELVTVLNKRVEEATARGIQAEQRVHELQLKNVQLEKLTEKASLEHSGKLSNLSANRRLCLNNPNVTHGMTADELRKSLEMLTEEKETLKEALQKMLRAKEDDLKAYQEIIAQARKIFVDGLRTCSDLQ